MQEKDRCAVIAMMRDFYASNAVYSNGSDEIFNHDIDQCLGDGDYLAGYVFEEEGKMAGYGMLAKSFSTEFGKTCIWIEDLYVKEEFRGKGIGTAFMSFVKSKHPDAIFRLEVEADNAKAIHVYQKTGFSFLPYLEMKK